MSSLRFHRLLVDAINFMFAFHSMGSVQPQIERCDLREGPATRIFGSGVRGKDSGHVQRRAIGEDPHRISRSA